MRFLDASFYNRFEDAFLNANSHNAIWRRISKTRVPVMRFRGTFGKRESPQTRSRYCYSVWTIFVPDGAL